MTRPWEPETPAVDQATVAHVRAELSRQLDRRRWRHLFVAVAGMVGAFVGEIAVIAIVAGRGDSMGGRSRLPAFVVLFVAGALIASFGWQRYDLGRALLRLPLALVSIALLVPLLALTASVDRQPSPDQGASSATVAVLSGVAGDGAGVGGGGLAAALVDQQVATMVMGPAFEGPDPLLETLVRGRSMVRYRGNGKSLSLTVSHRRRAATGDVSSQPRVRGRTTSGRVAAGDWTVRVSTFGVPGQEATSMVQSLLTTAHRRLQAALNSQPEG